jgi:hypothetical protein
VWLSGGGLSLCIIGRAKAYGPGQNGGMIRYYGNPISRTVLCIVPLFGEQSTFLEKRDFR